MRRRDSETTIISFRVPNDVVAALDKARKPLEVSRGHLARNILVGHFHQSDNELVAQQVDELRQLVGELGDQLTALEHKLIRSVHLLLTTRAELSSADAKELLRQKVLL